MTQLYDQAAPSTPYLNAPDTAVEFALAQVGKPYVWGATGPNSYDCSGLMQAAWKSAGVSIPRTTYMQCRIGTAVASIAKAAPGDLIFPYVDESHVTMYIGNGQVVEAPEPGKNVQVVNVYGSAGGIRRVTDQVGDGAATAGDLGATGPGGIETNAASRTTSLISAMTSGKDWASLAYILGGGGVLLVLVLDWMAGNL